MERKIAQTLEDKPTGNLEKWQGYFHNTDPSVLDPNTLTYPSKNCFIPNKDKIVPRLGKTLLGQPFTTIIPGIEFDSFSQGNGSSSGIAFDATANGSSGTNSLTVAHTCAGNNRILWVSIFTSNSTGGDQVTGVTYNGVAMTLGLKLAHTANKEEYLYYLIAPDVGTHNIVVSATAIDSFLRLISASYTGAKQSSVPNVTASTAPGTGTSIAITAITTQNNCWLIGAVMTNVVDTITAGAGSVLRQQLLVSALLDSGGPITPAGSATLNANISPSDTRSGIMAAFEPVTTTTATVSHTCSGDNRILFVAVYVTNTGDGDKVTGVTYNGDAMTLGKKVALDADHERYLFYLVNPDAGTNDIIVTATAISGVIGLTATSYTGVKQVAPTIFASTGPSAAVTSISVSDTTVDDMSWLVGFFTGAGPYGGGLTAQAGTVLRGGNTNLQMADSGEPITPAGLASLGVDFTTSTTAIALLGVFSPVEVDPINENWPIIGHKKRYTNAGGYVMEVRVVRTGDNGFSGLKDQIEILFPDPVTGDLTWYSITERENILPAGIADRYYFDEFFDTNIDPALSRKNSRLVWVNGTNNVFSWSGGVAVITVIVPNVSITTNAVWSTLGFIDPALGGSDKIVVNGVAYTVTGGWNTSTLTLANTTGISINDIATAHISTDAGSLDVIPSPEAFDFCKQNKNYMFYGTFNSRQLYMSNNFNRPSSEDITRSVADLDDLTISNIADYNGSSKKVYRISIDTAGTPDTFQWQVNGGGGSTGVAITGSDQILAENVVIKFLDTTGHSVGDFWEITVLPAIGIIDSVTNRAAWGNFYFDLPRIPGEGYIFSLPANFWSMEVQESDLYVSDQYGSWSYINTQIAADLQSETISFTPLKQVSASKPIYPYMVGHMENYIVFVTENKTLDFIGRQAFLELPQMDYLSQDVEKDFALCDFQKGSIEYLSKRLYITSPKQSLMLVYDNQAKNKYWQPPQEYAENGILSIVNNTLISHSNLRDQTFNLFTGKSDNGGAFTVVIRTAYLSFGERWRLKNSNKSFLEGYMGGLPPLVFKAIQGINGCAGIFSHEVSPVYCLGADRAPLGEGSLGSHPNGSDEAGNDLNHFNEIYTKYAPILQYFFIAFQLECSTKNHTYEVLSMGVNAIESNTGNNSLIPEEEISRT